MSVRAGGKADSDEYKGRKDEQLERKKGYYSLSKGKPPRGGPLQEISFCRTKLASVGCTGKNCCKSQVRSVSKRVFDGKLVLYIPFQATFTGRRFSRTV